MSVADTSSREIVLAWLPPRGDCGNGAEVRGVGGCSRGTACAATEPKPFSGQRRRPVAEEATSGSS